MNKIDQYRKKIDGLDWKILSLLSERGKTARTIGRIKKKSGGIVLVPDREQAIYDRLSRINRGPYKNEAVLSIFREIVSATRALQAPLKIAFLGPEATFTHIAAVEHFGSSAEMMPQGSIQNIFEEVERRHADFGVVPVENSTEGMISHTLDMFVDTDLSISSEIVLRVQHHLLSREPNLKNIRVVYSHPHALAQCQRWLSVNLPHARQKGVDSTAAAARMAAHEKKSAASRAPAAGRASAAIASELAASRYGLTILKREIQDQLKNFTRFLVLGRGESKRTGRDKTSLLLGLKDEAGALYKILSPLAQAGINLTKIESRPLKSRAWEYVFFVDLDGHVSDKAIARVVEKVRRRCTLFKVLGSYPKSRIAS
ncbi:MAG: prephenate dehydratase [Deltaproteobacteria bacterium]|nr:prephenate dehydratase [Deltaproteobacteria bacterium]